MDQIVEGGLDGQQGPKLGLKVRDLFNVQNFILFLLPSSQRRPTKANAGQRRPTQAHEGPQQPTAANAGPRKPTVANEGQRRPTQAHEGQRRPTTANEGQRRPTKTKRGPNDARRIVWALGTFFYFISSCFNIY